MLKVLKFDFYKIFKSRAIRIYFIISLFFCLFAPTKDIITSADYSVWFLLARGTLPQLLIVLFSILLCTKDFTTDFIYNVYDSQNKFLYVLSKFLYLLFYTVLIYGITLFLYFLFDKIFGIGEFYGEAYSDYMDGEMENMICVFLSKVVGSIAFGTVLLFFSFLLKNAVVLLIAAPIYMFLGEYLYNFVDFVVEKLFGSTITIAKYTSFGAMNHLTINAPISDSVSTLIVSSVYIVICLCLSTLVFYRKKF